MKIKNLEPMVLNILQRSNEARKDDFKLYYYILKSCKLNTKITVEQFFWNVAKLNTAYGIPSFKTIERIRRKLQSKYPELKNDITQMARVDKITDYQEYNRS